jgi:cell division protein FtsL
MDTQSTVLLCFLCFFAGASAAASLVLYYFERKQLILEREKWFLERTKMQTVAPSNYDNSTAITRTYSFIN